MKICFSGSTHTDIENKLMVTQRGRGWVGMSEEFGINRYTLLYVK